MSGKAPGLRGTTCELASILVDGRQSEVQGTVTQRKQRPLRDLSAEDVVAAAELNYIDYWRCAGLSPNAEFSETEGVTRCITGLSQEIFNVVLRCHLSGPDIEGTIDSLIDQFRSRRLNLIWHVGMLTEPKDLGSRLEEKGYPHDYDLTSMAIDLDSVSHADRADGSTVKEVVSRKDCSEWISCLTRSWESPKEVAPWMLGNACFNVDLEREMRLSLPRKMFLGSLDGVPVSASMLFWSEDIAGLQAVGTIRESRGRGVGGATVRAALVEAHRMGFRTVVVLSTVEGVGMYKKVGFLPFGKLPEHSMDFRKAGEPC